MKKIITMAMALAVPLGMAACGDDSTGPDETPEEGSFSATVTGDINTSFNGGAWFGEGTDPDTNETGWVLWLTTAESETTGQTIYFVRHDSRPGTGSHDLANIETDDELSGGVIGALYFDYTAGAASGLIGSTDGTLQITDSDSNRMQGSFTIQGAGTLFEDGEPVEANVTITGEFDAVGGDVFYPNM